MKKKLCYLIILFISLFVGIGRVEAASELACRYPRDNYDIYIYQNPSSNVKPFITKMYLDGTTLYVYNNPKYEISTGADGYLLSCPAKVKSCGFLGGDGKICFEGAEGVNFSKKYSAWSCDYQISSDHILNVKQNASGLITYSYTKNGKSVEGKELKMFGQSFGSNSCPKYLKISSYSSDNYATFFNKYQSNTDRDDYADATVISGTSPDSGADEKDYTLSPGTYCGYRNLDDTVCKGDSGDINGDCGQSSSSKLDSWFMRADYMFYSFSGSTINHVYLPKASGDPMNVSEDFRQKLKDAWDSWNADEISKEELLNEFFVEYDASEIEAFANANRSGEVNEDGCYRWFNSNSSTAGLDYEGNFYWYQFKNTNPADNADTEDKGTEEGETVEAKEGPYYCIYDAAYGDFSTNEGKLILRYNEEKTKLLLISCDFDYVYNSYSCPFDDCEQVDGLSFVGFGDAELNLSKNFQNNLVGGICPKQINYSRGNGVLTVCKEEDEECLNGGAGILGNLVEFTTSYDEECLNDVTGSGKVDVNECGDLINDDLKKILNQYMTWFRILVPIIVLILGTVDFAQAVFSSNEDGMKKAQSKFIKRLIIAVVIFLIPTFVNLLMDIANLVWGWNANCDIG